MNANKTKTAAPAHHEIATRHFGPAALRRVTRAGVRIVDIGFVPDHTGSYARGQTAYVTEDGRILTAAQVYNLAGLGV